LSHEFKRVSESFDQISMGKKLGELINLKLMRMGLQNEKLISTVESQKTEIANLIVERDQFRYETKLLQGTYTDNRTRTVVVELKFKNLVENL
jgi:hypothetical protein